MKPSGKRKKKSSMVELSNSNSTLKWLNRKTTSFEAFLMFSWKQSHNNVATKTMRFHLKYCRVNGASDSEKHKRKLEITTPRKTQPETNGRSLTVDEMEVRFFHCIVSRDHKGYELQNRLPPVKHKQKKKGFTRNQAAKPKFHI